MEILTVLSLFFELLVDFLPFILIIMITISLKKIAQNQKKSAAKVRIEMFNVVFGILIIAHCIKSRL